MAFLDANGSTTGLIQEDSVNEKYKCKNSYAQNVAIQSVSAYPEVTVNSIETNIVITKIATQSVSRQSIPLGLPADTTQNIYYIETVIDGQVSPLVPFPANILGGIPGLTAPVTLTTSARQFCENPQVLTL